MNFTRHSLNTYKHSVAANLGQRAPQHENVLYEVSFFVCNVVTAGYFHLMPLIPILEEIIGNQSLFTSSQLHVIFVFFFFILLTPTILYAAFWTVTKN